MGTIFVRASRRAKAYSRSARLKGLIRKIDTHVVKMGGYHSHVRSQQLLKKTKNNLQMARVRNIAENVLKRRAAGGLSMKREMQLKSLQARLTAQQYRLKY